jgi:large subunit ribosomal protein L10
MTTAHVSAWKYKEVEEITSLLTTKKIIGVVEIGGIPGPQLQRMRKNLNQVATVRSARNTLLKKAIEETGKTVPGLEKLNDNVQGQAAIIATDMNPFKLFAQIKATRTNAPAKGGEILAYDLMVHAGETPFKPGPIVGELQKVGIPAAIQEGKVVIKTDKVIVPAGKKIPADVAKMLARLEIFPIELGMTLHAVYENGDIFKGEVLDIDMDVFMGKMQRAHLSAICLAIESGWISKSTIQPLLTKAYRNAHILGVERDIMTKDTSSEILAKAQNQAISVAKSASDESLDEDLKKTVKEK